MSDDASDILDEHVRQIIAWHFSPDTGTPFWLEWARQSKLDVVSKINCFSDLKKLPRFEDAWLRKLGHDKWIPHGYKGQPFKVFETGGTTGMPKQRLSWEDHLADYTEFSRMLDDHYADAFPHGSNWLMLGPTGPRRLRLSIEHLANIRGGACYFIDLDPRWVKSELSQRRSGQVKQYMNHVIDQAVQLLCHRNITCLFSTPRLLEALDEKINVSDSGIKGVFCGGTSMTPQVIRFLVEEILGNRAALVPTYGNTLMGLAVAKPVAAEADYALTYYAPQPRAVLRVVDTGNPDHTVRYDQWGRIELTTLTREFLMPRFLERDEAVRRHPWMGESGCPWDGVGEVRPLGAQQQMTVEGVY